MRGTGLHASGLAQSGWAAPPHKSPRPLGRDGIFVLAPRRSKAAFTCHADSQQALLAHCNKQKHPPACRRFICQNARALAGGKPHCGCNQQRNSLQSSWVALHQAPSAAARHNFQSLHIGGNELHPGERGLFGGFIATLRALSAKNLARPAPQTEQNTCRRDANIGTNAA